MGTRRKFSKQFKAEAVALVKHQGLSINQVAKDLGVSWAMVNKWVEQAAADSGEKPELMTTAEREELAALRRENRTLKMEREILKKAAAFFAKESD